MDNNNQPQQPLPSTPQPVPPQPIPPQPASPQPMMTPQPPVGSPIGPIPTVTPQPIPPKKGLSKGALWGIIGGSIAFVLLIVGIILAVVFLSGPSKEDYLAIQSQVKDIKEQRNKINKALPVHINAIFSGANSNGDLKKALDSYSSGIDKLKDAPALKDKEVKKSYDALIREAEEIKTYAQAFVDIEEPSIAAYKKCDGRSQIAAMRITNLRARIVALRDASKECSDALTKMADSKVDKIVDYVKATQKTYNDQVAIFDDMIKAGDKRDEVAYQAAQRRLKTQSREFFKIQDKLVEIQNDANNHNKMPKLDDLENVISNKLKK